MEQARLDNAFQFIRVFLESKAPLLYNRRRVIFRKVSHYTGFDGMLKREIAYCRYDANEVLCECRSTVTRTGFTVRIEQGPPISPKKDAERETFHAFLIRNGSLETKPNRTIYLRLPDYEGEISITMESPVAFSLHASNMLPRSGSASSAISGTLEEDFNRWLAKVLGDWLAMVAGHRVESKREAIPDGSISMLTSSIPLSSIDLDISGEDVPHVFRWQENKRFADATFADLPEAECLKILEENRAAPHSESRLQGISRLEIDEDSACIALRYAHMLLDPDSESENAEGLPFRNKGHIVIENDFWEFHIDAVERLLIGEYRKWRTN